MDWRHQLEFAFCFIRICFFAQKFYSDFAFCFGSNDNGVVDAADTKLRNSNSPADECGWGDHTEFDILVQDTVCLKTNSHAQTQTHTWKTPCANH